MDLKEQLTKEGYYSVYGKVGARTEMPGCSLCMGNQAFERSGDWGLRESGVWRVRVYCSRFRGFRV